MDKKKFLNWKQFRDGTHRTCHPEQTYERIAPFLPVMGITRVANVTGLDTIGIPVCMVARPNARSLAVSQGKGFTLAAARVSGVMEAIEGYHAERLDVNTRLGGVCDLAENHRVVDVNNLARNKRKKFTDQTRIPWVEAVDLYSGDPIWVPYETVHLDFTLPLCFDGEYFISDTNGLASGNCPEEAIVHGLSEIVERDALTLWALRDKDFQDSRRVDFKSIDDPRCKEVIARFFGADVIPGVWDISTDIDLPVFMCKITQADFSDFSIRPAMGSGCHPDRDIALMRALTEAAQSRLTFISGARDDQPIKNYKRFQNGECNNWIYDILRKEGQHSYRGIRSFQGECLEDDLDHILKSLKSVGMTQALYVDLTKQHFGISVVKVIVPGLENHTNADHRVPGKRAMAILSKRCEDA